MATRKLLGSVGALVAVTFGAILALRAAPPEPADLKARVQQLVGQLGVPAKQVAAETELIKLGPDILPYLPDAKAKLTDAQRERLTAIRSTLQEAKVLRELAPRTVTLQNPSIPLSQALDQLKQQAGIEIADAREAKTDDPPLKLNLQRATFWQALDTIAREADLNVSVYGKGGQISLRDGPHRELPVCYSGLFRIQVRRVNVVQDLLADTHLCTVHLEIAWEPRFHPLFLQNKLESLVAQDDKGMALKAPNDGGRSPLLGSIFSEVQLTLEAPRRAANSLGLLKGDLSVIGPGKMLEFSFDKLAKVEKQTPDDKLPSKTQEGVTVKLREFTTESDLWTVGVLLEYPPGGPDFESFESWLVNNKAYLVAKTGQRFTDSGYEIDEQTGNRAVITYRFAEENDLVLGKPADWKLVYRTPGVMAKVPVHFEFKDLPLP
jgi:hypothetical protein